MFAKNCWFIATDAPLRATVHDKAGLHISRLIRATKKQAEAVDA